jgi:NADH-quinone oxidoreductase subunit M
VSEQILLLLIAVPLAAAGLVAMVPAREARVARGLAVVAALVELGLTAFAATSFDANLAEFQLVHQQRWLTPLGVHIELGVDGTTLFPILLVAAVVPAALLASWPDEEDIGRELCVPLLVLQAAALTVFLAQNVGLMLAGWELALVAAWALMIPRAHGAARAWLMRWFFAAQCGAALMLGALLFLAVSRYDLSQGHWSLQYGALAAVMLPEVDQLAAFVGVVAAAVFVMPLFPLHGWFAALIGARSPVAAVGVAVILVELGVHLMSHYAVAMFPLGAHRFGALLCWLAVAGLVHAALALRIEDELRRIVGYVALATVSVQWLGVLLVHPDGLMGAKLFGLGRGLGVAALVLVASRITRDVGADTTTKVRGLGKKAPLLAGLLLLALLAAMGAPSSAAFAGLVAVLSASFDPDTFAIAHPGLVATLVCGLLLVGMGIVFRRWYAMVGGEGVAVRPTPAISALTVAVLLVPCVVVGAAPAVVFTPGSWSARAQVEQQRTRTCLAVGARRLSRPVLYQDLAVDCSEALETLKAGSEP